MSTKLSISLSFVATHQQKQLLPFLSYAPASFWKFDLAAHFYKNAFLFLDTLPLHEHLFRKTAAQIVCET